MPVGQQNVGIEDKNDQSATGDPVIQPALWDEAETRKVIDAQLRQAGWLADTEALRFSSGARPRHGVNQAIAEWPTESGPADYLLFVGLMPLGTVEAKRAIKDIPGHIPQARRYSRDYAPSESDVLPGGPWGEHKIPFVFATNGRSFLRQIKEKSGIWFQDVRDSTNHPRPLEGWHSPEGLLALLKIDEAKATRELRKSAVDLPGIRDYQVEAIREVESAIADGKREMLVAMATGTGKTRTCLSLIYRLIKAGRFYRILFLVDRATLGEQASNAFKEVKLENLQAFADIYDLKELDDIRPDLNTRVHLATVQGMVKRVLYPGQDDAPVPVDRYDCIIVDECHRGYTLDRELTDEELLFKDEKDYISKYRRVLDHFDAVKIGLTATPALHTSEIFGKPVFTYSYRRAVIEGWLADHEPPIRLITNLAEHGIKWKKGEEMKVFNEETGTIDLATAPDDLQFDVDHFNKQVITEPFNRVVCERLAEEIDPALPGKTLIFCVEDSHADLVVRLLNDSFEKKYGPIHDATVAKITGFIDDPLLTFRKFKNEELPKFAVTVDLLTTGIDVPQIVNIVFIRRVRSRILYEQMLGRGTRLCPDLFGPGQDKEVFRIFDAVDIYRTLEDFSTMKPVVADPKVTIAKLFAMMSGEAYRDARKALHEELLAKLQRKKRWLGKNREKLKSRFGLDPEKLMEAMRTNGAGGAIEFLKRHRELIEFLDSVGMGGSRTVISEHPDHLLRVERGYGTATKPEDYLDGFGKWLRENMNKIPALLVAVKRPRDLTREQLKSIKLALDEAGFSEVALQIAWREWKNEDIAATIVGFIRQRAMGAPLKPYRERVDHAVLEILSSRAWTPPQRQWLQKIANQIREETVVDHEALDHGVFGASGGFARINKAFDGQLESVLGDLHERIWRDTAA